jgi:hypothetical protein
MPGCGGGEFVTAPAAWAKGLVDRFGYEAMRKQFGWT